MSESIVPGGKYFLLNFGSNSYAGVGPVPPIYPPYPSPLRPIGHTLKEPFSLEPKQGNKYVITHKLLRLSVGYDDEGIVRLTRQGGKEIQWVILDGYGPGRYRLKATDSERYWTMSREDGRDVIKLEGENVDSSQEWRFEKASW
ncbi:unnamed protein product [Rhizoctonia solani]|uniref:Uncharacterized protein n=1 Tax=Rhizoctonia solani TaxID=456999 RepID=A0A8H2XGR7_9AGAM|nr:unnamed protein product [Rhizoctonia solani]